MVIGKGMLAKRFDTYKDSNEVLIFASGVSNSSEISINEFEREKELLMSNLKSNEEKRFIYFSSFSLNDNELKNTPYHLHKKEMEELVISKSNNYLIFRLPNVIGLDGNSNNVINFFIDRVKDNRSFEIWKNATRNIIDIDHIFEIVSYIIDSNAFINLVSNIIYENSIKVFDIVKTIEKMANKKANYTIVEKGYNLKVVDENINNIMAVLDIKQPDLATLIEKYRKI